MPPSFGVSATGAATGAAPKMAAARIAASALDLVSTVASCSWSFLFIEPDGRQVLIEEMARADLPPLHIRLVWDDAVPPYHPDLVRLGVDHVFLELAHQGALLGKVGLAEHFTVEIQLLLVFEIPVIAA